MGFALFLVTPHKDTRKISRTAPESGKREVSVFQCRERIEPVAVHLDYNKLLEVFMFPMQLDRFVYFP